MTATLTVAEHAARELIPENTFKVYSGKPGCACGCRGFYRYSRQYRDEAQRERSYATIGDDEINDAQIRKVVRILLAAPNLHRIAPEPTADGGTWGTIYTADIAERVYTAYLIDRIGLPIEVKA